MNRKFFSFLVALVTMFGCLGSVQAQEWKFVGEKFYGTSFYFFNPSHKVFLKATSTTTSTPSEATLFTMTDKNVLGAWRIKYENNGTKYVYESSGNQSWGTKYDRQWVFNEYQTEAGLGYQIWHNDPANMTRQRFINYNGSSIDYPREKFNDNNRTWYMISPAQMTDELSRQAKIQGYNLTPYTGEHGEWNDVSGYIKNANVYQSYSDNTKIPFGWTAYKHESGNGTYSQGTGDTKLECWNGTANKFDVDYYQIIKLPKGKYRLSADVLFRGTENAVALYASQQGTSNEIQTLVNVSGDELNTYYVEFEVTSDNTEFSIGVKKVGTNTADNAWMAADNFRLEYWTELDDANLKIKAGCYGTFVAPFDVTLPEGVVAYSVASATDKEVTLSPFDLNAGNVLPAGNPVIVKHVDGTAVDETYYGPFATTETITKNSLLGFYKADVAISKGSYILQDQGKGQMFYVVGESPIVSAKNRCCLPAGGTGAKVLSITFAESEETAVGTVSASSTIVGYYSVNGAKLSAPKAGVNIVKMSDGTVKKVLMK